MDITPPFGFSKIVPLDRQHRLKFERVVPASLRNAQMLPVSVGEFELAGRDMPVVFAPVGNNTNTFFPVALCGLLPADNLFVEGDRWDTTVYPAAYVRRWPFCMAAVRDPQGTEQQRIVCVEESVISPDGEALVDAQNEPTAFWKEYEPLVNEYERDLTRTEQLCKLLSDFKLLEGFRLNAEVTGLPKLEIGGLYRVSEKALVALPADQLRMFIERGAMRAIYAHIASLDRVSMLLSRHRARHLKAA